MRKLLILTLATVFLLGMCTPVFGNGGINLDDSSANASTEVVVMLINENFAVSGGAIAIGNESDICIMSMVKAIVCGNEVSADNETDAEANAFLGNASASAPGTASAGINVTAGVNNTVENSGTALAVSGDATAIQCCPSIDADIDVDADADATRMDDMYETHYHYYYYWWW